MLVIKQRKVIIKNVALCGLDIKDGLYHIYYVTIP